MTVDLSDDNNNAGGATGDELTAIENITGSAHADSLTGDGDDNIIEGGGQPDIIPAVRADIDAFGGAVNFEAKTGGNAGSNIRVDVVIDASVAENYFAAAEVETVSFAVQLAVGALSSETNIASLGSITSTLATGPTAVSTDPVVVEVGTDRYIILNADGSFAAVTAEEQAGLTAGEYAVVAILDMNTGAISSQAMLSGSNYFNTTATTLTRTLDINLNTDDLAGQTVITSLDDINGDTVNSQIAGPGTISAGTVQVEVGTDRYVVLHDDGAIAAVSVAELADLIANRPNEFAVVAVLGADGMITSQASDGDGVKMVGPLSGSGTSGDPHIITVTAAQDGFTLQELKAAIEGHAEADARLR